MYLRSVTGCVSVILHYVSKIRPLVQSLSKQSIRAQFVWTDVGRRTSKIMGPSWRFLPNSLEIVPLPS